MLAEMGNRASEGIATERARVNVKIVDSAGANIGGRMGLESMTIQHGDERHVSAQTQATTEREGISESDVKEMENIAKAWESLNTT